MAGLRLVTVVISILLLALNVFAQYGSSNPNASITDASQLPTVDLGYEIHRAITFNETGQFYNFSNIRYAAPPVGDLRFRAPQPPETNRSSVNDGSMGRTCVQANPSWTQFAFSYLQRYFTGQGNNMTQADLDRLNSSVNAQSVLQSVDPRTTEDCLFLDVLVPQNIWQNKGAPNKGAPVLVWIYGGGYVDGDKSGNNPAGLIYRSEANNSGGVIFVALNYRLGAFGCAYQY